MEYKRAKFSNKSRATDTQNNQDSMYMNAIILGNQGMLTSFRTPIQRVITCDGEAYTDLNQFLSDAMATLEASLEESMAERQIEAPLNPELLSLATGIFQRRFEAEEIYDFDEVIAMVESYLINHLEGRAMVLDVPIIPRTLEKAQGTAPSAALIKIEHANVLYRSMCLTEFLTVAQAKTLSSSGSFYSPVLEYSRRYLDWSHQILAAFYFDDTIGNLLNGIGVQFQNRGEYFKKHFTAGCSSDRSYHLKSEVPSSAKNVSFKRNKTLCGVSPSSINASVENIQLGDRKMSPFPEKESALFTETQTTFPHWAVPELSSHLLAIRVEDIFEPDSIKKSLEPYSGLGYLADVWDMTAKQAYPKAAMPSVSGTDLEPMADPVPKFTTASETPSSLGGDIYTEDDYQFNSIDRRIRNGGQCFWDSVEQFLNPSAVQTAAAAAQMQYGVPVDLDMIGAFVEAYNAIPGVNPIMIRLYLFYYNAPNAYDIRQYGQPDNQPLILGYLHVPDVPNGHFVPAFNSH